MIAYHSYRIYGYSIRVNFELRLPNPAHTDELADVVISRRRGGPAARPREGGEACCYESPFLLEDRPRVTLERSGRLFLLRIAGGGDFVIGRKRIHFYQDPTASDYLVEKLLLGTVLSVWLELRGHLVLHAAATTDGRGGAMAFLGPSGAGKSTLAQALVGRGLRLITDDLLVLAEGPDGIYCRPGPPTVSLTRESYRHFAARQSLDPVAGMHMAPKYYHRVHHMARRDNVPLSAMYFIKRSSMIRRFEAHSCSPSNAFLGVLKNGFLALLTHDVNTAGRLAALSRLVKTVPIEKLDVPDDLDALEKIESVVDRGVALRGRSAVVSAAT